MKEGTCLSLFGRCFAQRRLNQLKVCDMFSCDLEPFEAKEKVLQPRPPVTLARRATLVYTCCTRS